MLEVSDLKLPVDHVEDAIPQALEHALGKTAIREYLPLQPGDVPSTSANTAALEAAVGYKPATPVTEGVRRFAEWYLARYSNQGA